jgi:glutathione S-transferase
MSDLRIFSYLPNPRIWKATIAGRLCGVDVEVRGAAPNELQEWLWDFDARPTTHVDPIVLAGAERTGKIGFSGTKLFKTDAFLEAHPFGTVPAAFSPDGRTGIFESNSIMRTVARLGAKRFPLYGRDAYEASRIDSFLDVSLVFARDAQIYLLALRGETISPEIHARATEAFTTYAEGLERALGSNRRFLVGDDVSLADICFACEFTLFSNERARGGALVRQGLRPVLEAARSRFALTFEHLDRLVAHPAFEPDLARYLFKLDAVG